MNFFFSQSKGVLQPEINHYYVKLGIPIGALSDIPVLCRILQLFTESLISIHSLES